MVWSVGAGIHNLELYQIVTGRLVPAFADYVYADPQDVVPVPSTVAPHTAIGEPLGCIVDAYQRTCPPVGAITAVVGLGFMGLLMTRLLALSPVSAVWGIGRTPHSRATASEAGATQVFTPDDPRLSSAAAELVVEATGSQSGLDLASRLATENAVVSILGYHQARSRSVDMQAWNWKGLTVTNAHIRNRHRLANSTLAAMRLLAADRLDIAPLFTHRYTLERLNDAFKDLRDKPAGFIKAIIDVNAKTLPCQL